MSDSLRPHRLQHARLPCPSSTPGACSNSCPSSQWCHPAISSSVIPFSSCLQSLPASRSFQMSHLILHIRWPKYWSFSYSISPSNEHSGLISFRIDWLYLLEVLGTLKSLLQYHSSKSSILWHSAFFMVQLAHLYVTTGKTIALIRRTFVCNSMDYTVHRILQDRILEWVAFPFSRVSFQHRDWTQVSNIVGRFFTNWFMSEAQATDSTEI